jgi:hypothetical protein
MGSLSTAILSPTVSSQRQYGRFDLFSKGIGNLNLQLSFCPTVSMIGERGNQELLNQENAQVTTILISVPTVMCSWKLKRAVSQRHFVQGQSGVHLKNMHDYSNGDMYQHHSFCEQLKEVHVIMYTGTEK